MNKRDPRYQVLRVLTDLGTISLIVGTVPIALHLKFGHAMHPAAFAFLAAGVVLWIAAICYALHHDKIEELRRQGAVPARQFSLGDATPQAPPPAPAQPAAPTEDPAITALRAQRDV